VAKTKRVNGNGPKDVSKTKVSKGSIAPSPSRNGFEKVRKGKMIASLERHDQFFSKHAAMVEKLFKAGKKKSEIAKQFEKECGGKKQADHMVFYSLNRIGLIHTKNDGELVRRHEALRKELKNGKTSS
jgi:hypothetical protein